MKALILGAIGATVLLVSTADAQRGFEKRPVGGRYCSTGELTSCKRCCLNNNFGDVCVSRCEVTYKGKAPAKAATRSRKKADE